MMVDTEALVVVTEASRNSSKVTHIVDENGLAVIPKSNKPRYIAVGFEEYETVKGIGEAREEKLRMTADALIEENMGAFLELTKRRF